MSYTKFVMVGQQRTGSTFLQMLLASNKTILSFGELFNPADNMRIKSAKRIEKPITLQDNPIEYLGDYVYTEYPGTIKAVGFRLFYTHARNNAWKEIWEYLKHSDIKIIHMKRRNLLDRYLSLQLALRSEEWIAFKGTRPSDAEPITLNLKECLKDFRKIIRFQEEMDDFFKDSPKIEIIYEDLVARQIEECERLQNFLGIDSQKLSTKMVKQQTRKKSEVIANYDELKQQFTMGVSKGWAKEEWLDFFEEA